MLGHRGCFPNRSAAILRLGACRDFRGERHRRSGFLVVGDSRKPGHEASRRLVFESIEGLGSGEKNFLQNVIDFELASEFRTHFVVHENGKAALIFSKQQAEGLRVAGLEAVHEVTRGGLGVHGSIGQWSD
jgi:hypothetical protein